GSSASVRVVHFVLLFFSSVRPTTAVSSLSLHDALPIFPASAVVIGGGAIGCEFASMMADLGTKVTILEALPQIIPGVDKDVTSVDRKSTRLNSSHGSISYAVFCLKKKNRSTHETSVVYE